MELGGFYDRSGELVGAPTIDLVQSAASIGTNKVLRRYRRKVNVNRRRLA